MTELPKYGRVLKDNYKKYPNFVVKVKKINLMKFDIK